MKKGLAVKVVVGVVVLGAAGYAGLWFQQASTIKEGVVNWFAKINASEDAKAGNLKAAYGDVKVTGFPSSFTIEITDPAFEYTPEAARKAFFPATQPLVPQTTPEAEAAKEVLKDTWKLNGVLKIATQPVAHRYTLSANGSAEGVFRDSSGDLPWKSGDSDFTMSLQTSGKVSDTMLYTMDYTNPEQVQTLAKNIRAFSVSSPHGMEIKQPETGDVLASLSEMNLDFAVNDNENPQIESHGLLKMSGVYVSDAYQQAHNRFLQQFYGMPDNVMENMSVSNLFSSSVAGKQDMDVAFTVSAPREFDWQKDGTVNLAVSSLRLKNDFYDISLPLTFTYARKSDQVNSSWKLEGMMNFSPKFGDAILAQTEKAAREAFSGSNALALAIFGINRTPDMDAFKEKVATLIPAFDKTGPISLVVDGGFKGAVVPGNPSPAGTMDIHNVEISHNLWGLELSGDVTMPEQRSNLVLLCTHCNAMVDNLLTYAKDGQELASMVNKDYKVFPITEKLAGDVKSFVNSLGETGAEDKLKITVASDGTGNRTISGKPFAEVQGLALQTFLPYMMMQQKQNMSPAAPPLPPLPAK